MSARRVFSAAGMTGLLLVIVTGCSEDINRQSVLDPQGERAHLVNGLWTLMLVVGVVVWIIVMVVLAVALIRRGRTRHDEDGEDDGNRRRPLWLIGTVGAIIPGVIIAALTFVSAGVLLDIDPQAKTDGPVIEVVAHQYWWEVNYPQLGVSTANEIHIPTGQRVRVELTSADVIHSFWVPQLTGKIDNIPGQTNQVWLAADHPGTYWGQCAEFCGQQHALMRMLVVAHDPAEFDGWVAAQGREADTAAAPEPVPENVARGEQVFLSSSCVYCHAVGGTPAEAAVGPDLTHFASRETIAAGILPNNRGNLAGWILDPQAIKPGNLMPGTDIGGDDLQYLLDYLESLE